jgi:hypothetical protein
VLGVRADMNTKEKIDEIIKHFNFKKVHKVMKSLKWEYYDEGIPDINSLKKTARRVLMSVSKSKLLISAQSGGFKASKIRYKEGNLKPEIIYKLEFIIASYDSLIC